MKTSTPLSVYDFGAQLLETKDLDPVYVMLHEADLGKPTLYRWLIAYWAFYHCGTAAWASNARRDRRSTGEPAGR